MTFKVAVAARPETHAESDAESTTEGRVLDALADGPLSKSEIASSLGLKGKTGQLNRVVAKLVAEGVVELTVPQKPTSRLQKYRIVEGAVR